MSDPRVTWLQVHPSGFGPGAALLLPPSAPSLSPGRRGSRGSLVLCLRSSLKEVGCVAGLQLALQRAGASFLLRSHWPLLPCSPSAPPPGKPPLSSDGASLPLSGAC